MAKIEGMQTKKRNKSPLVLVLKIAIGVAFFFAALMVAFLTFRVIRDFVASWQLTNLPGVSVREATPTPDASGQSSPVNASVPMQPVGGPTPPPWDGAKRVSMLIMGLDYRDWEAGQGPPRTDTMILFTIDPIKRTAGMLSIPRDLWVNIPGFDYGRINTAYTLGEGSKLPGGGPALAAKTVEGLLGVPIDYYAQVDFDAFVKFIDTLGGVTVTIPEDVKLDPMGNGKADQVKTLKAGTYNLPGKLALAYVRLRKTQGGDFDRSQRQQAVIMGIRNRILKFNMMPMLVSKAPELYNELSSGVHTNLNLDQAIRLAWLAVQIPKENIQQGAIGAEQVTFAKSPDGTQDVLKPRTEQIRTLRDQIFSESGSANPIAASMDPAELVKAEAAKVVVLNASSVPGLAAKTTDFLKSKGINVIETGNADKVSSTTEITFNTGKPYTLKFLVDLMKINQFRIRHFYDPSQQADITIVVGDDWATNSAMQ